MSLHKVEAQFFEHLTTQTKKEPQFVLPKATLSREQIVKIYKDSAEVGLQKTLERTFEVYKKLVGDDFFNILSLKYVRSHIPRTHDLNYYGDRFADFIPTFPNADKVPYLADVARLEWTVAHALIGLDNKNLDFDGLSKLSSTEQEQVIFQVVQNASLIASNYPIDKIWDFSQKTPLEGETLDLSEEAVVKLFVWCDKGMLKLDRLSDDLYAMLQALQIEQPFGKLCESLMSLEVSFDVEQAFSELIKRRYIEHFYVGI